MIALFLKLQKIGNVTDSDINKIENHCFCVFIY